MRFRPPNKGQNRSAPQTPSKNAIKYICKKGTFFWRHQDVLHPMAEYSSTPQGGTRVPPKYPKGVPISGNTWATTRSGDRYSAIRAPRSGRILLRRDPIFELVKHRRQRSPQTRIFSPQDDLVCRRPRCGKREKMARYALFDIDDTSHGNYPPC